MADLIYSILRGITSLVGLEQGFINMWEAIRDFLELGGPVLYLVAVVLAIMWLCIVERLIYFFDATTTLDRGCHQALGYTA